MKRNKQYFYNQDPKRNETTWLCEPENDLRTRYIQNQPFNEASKTCPRRLSVPRYLYQKGEDSSEQTKELVVEVRVKR